MSTCAQAGTVKTYDGEKIAKDSAAQLRLHFEQKTSHNNEVFAAFVTKIDNTELYDKTLRGPNHWSRRHDENIDLVYWMDNNLNAARKIKKAYLQAREHRISIQGHVSLTEKRTRKTSYTDRVFLKFTPATGRDYEVGAQTDGTTWVFWIADKETGEVVSSVDYSE